MSDTDPFAPEETALADPPLQLQAVDASTETQGTNATPTSDSADTTATADGPSSSNADTIPTDTTTTTIQPAPRPTSSTGENTTSSEPISTSLESISTSSEPTRTSSVGSAIVPRPTNSDAPIPPTAGAPAPKPTTFAGGAVITRSGSSIPAPNPTVSQEPIVSVPGVPPRISTSDVVFPQTSAPSLPSALPADSIPSIAPVAPPPAPAPGASLEASLPSVVTSIPSASIQTSSLELPTSNASPPPQSSPTSPIITSTARVAGMPPPPQASIPAVQPPTSANSTAQPQLSTALISILVTFGIVITVAAAAFVAVYKRKLSRDAKQKKRQIPKALAPSVSNEYLGDTERGVVVRGRVSMASSVDVPSVDGAKNPTSNVHPDAISSNDVYFWPFAARVDTEEEECTSPTRIDGATTAVDTGGNTSHYYTDTEDGAVKKRVPSFELLPGGVHAAASDEAFSYYGFGASRIPRLNALEPQGLVIVNEPFEMEDGLSGVAYMTDSGETNLLTGGHHSQRNVSTRSSREHRFNSSSPSSIVKSLSANVSVEGHHSLSRKTSMQAEIWDA
ncbi:hypothetical protein BJ741DRAFT_601431 [Chytriomyces cf. hyalinus JEL632]|nr:hypothetical protein BJ741DRAFT_601431 [Chytriomyces cf. hyalinus JEL632]